MPLNEKTQLPHPVTSPTPSIHQKQDEPPLQASFICPSLELSLAEKSQVGRPRCDPPSPLRMQARMEGKG